MVLRKNKNWSEGEDAYLRDKYPTLKARDIGCALGRTEKSVNRRANRLGISTKTNKVTLSTVEKAFTLVGFTLLDTSYVNSQTKIQFECSNGHKDYITWNKFTCGRGCPKCYYHIDNMYDKIETSFQDAGYTLVTKISQYKGSKYPLQFICPKGHYHHIRWDSFNSGSRCGKCKPQHSKPEKEIREYIAGLGVKVEGNVRNVIPPYELDIFISNHKLAIEYCGLRWHGELFSDRPRNYHRNKLDMCTSKGIRLITIFEDEYMDRPDIVLSRIRQSLMLNTCRLFARKLTVCSVSLTEARDFLNSHHLQGYSPCSHRFALKDGNKIVQVITFGKLSRNHANVNNTCIELKRLAGLPNTTIVGGASKLFKYALKNMDPTLTTVKSYCDRRWSVGLGETVYDRLGFKFVSETKYTPHYTKRQKRYRNQSLRKTKEEQSSCLTEWDIRQNQGYDRIWDCGHLTYIYNVKKGGL